MVKRKRAKRSDGANNPDSENNISGEFNDFYPRDIAEGGNLSNKEVELLERERRIAEEEAKRGKGRKVTDAEKKTRRSEKKVKSIRCPNCGSTQTHVRITTGELVCHSCGAVTSIRGEVKGGISKEE